MKKRIFAVALSTLAALTFAMPVLAATEMLLSPASVSVNSGQSFVVTITFNPQGESIYTAKAELKFPAELLEIKSFAFAQNWMPLSQSGYDLVDNQNGVLVKTAGYPGGTSASAVFGTATFIAKKSGTGVISVGSNSLALNASNQNVVSSTPNQVAVKISLPPPTQLKLTPQPAPKPQSASVEQPLGAAESVELDAKETTSETVESGQEASVIKAESALTYWLLLMMLIALVSFGVGVFVGQKGALDFKSVFRSDK